MVALPSGASVTIPGYALETIEVSRGKRHHAAWGALTGALAGIAAASFAPTECSGFAFSSNSCRRKNGLAFGALGAGAGALIGWTTKTDKWQRVGGRQPELRISMPKGGLGAQLKVKW